ncbi:MAG: lipoprotein [bacterium]|nr:lipoprotein [bacterium]
MRRTALILATAALVLAGCQDSGGNAGGAGGAEEGATPRPARSTSEVVEAWLEPGSCPTLAEANAASGLNFDTADYAGFEPTETDLTCILGDLEAAIAAGSVSEPIALIEASSGSEYVPFADRDAAQQAGAELADAPEFGADAFTAYMPGSAEQPGSCAVITAEVSGDVTTALVLTVLGPGMAKDAVCQAALNLAALR